ncbi:MAG: CatB-related O-acetyltransferase [Neisseriaceae bacterium]|nr:CatB-related O-acetyltransferase [Neisseriaceae bacterium]
MGLQHPYTRFSTSAITYENNYFPNMQLNFIKHKLPLYKQNAINICDDVWIGAYCMLKPGITIGTGAVIGARSMVTKDVPPYAIVGGNPAKIIKMRFSDKLIEQLLVSEWFKYDIRQMAIPVNIDIEKFIDEFYKFKSQCRLIDKRNYIDTFRNLNIKIVEV